MKVNVDIIPYSEEACISLEYVPDADIKFDAHHNSLTIHANAEGLLFLAKICLTLAQDDTPNGSHIHFDGFNFVHSDAFDLTIARI